MIDARREGHRAYQNGIPLNGCPYSSKSPAGPLTRRDEWLRGWLEAQQQDYRMSGGKPAQEAP